MAPQKPPRRPAPQQSPFARYPPRPPAGPPEVVSPAWIAKALGLSLAAAAVLAYLAVCLLVHLGAPHYLLSPSSKMDATPASPFQPVRFDAGETGTPQLTGWWIPSYRQEEAAPTILYLHDGTGSLSAAVPRLNLIHRAHPNVFAIDYRGFGLSQPSFPNQSRMTADTAAALDYLVNTRHLPPERIVPYGEGLGAVLAAALSATNPRLPTVIIDNPNPDAFARAIGDRGRLLPMRLLIPDHFDIAQALRSTALPKLLFADSPFGYETERLHANQRLFEQVTGPKITVTFAKPHAEDQYLTALTRFLDQYLPAR